MAGQKPARTWRVGGIKLALWEDPFEQNGRTLTRFSVVIDKSYKGKNGDFQSTGRMDVFRDLPRLRFLVDQAYAYACQRIGENGESKGQE